MPPAAQLAARPDRAAERAAPRARGWPAARERPAARLRAVRLPEETPPEQAPAEEPAQPEAAHCVAPARRERASREPERLRAVQPAARARCAGREPQAAQPEPALRQGLRPGLRADAAGPAGPAHRAQGPASLRGASDARHCPGGHRDRAVRRQPDARRARDVRLPRAARGAPRRARGGPCGRRRCGRSPSSAGAGACAVWNVDGAAKPPCESVSAGSTVPMRSQVFARVRVSFFKMLVRCSFHWRASARRSAEPVVNRKRPKSGGVPPVLRLVRLEKRRQSPAWPFT